MRWIVGVICALAAMPAHAEEWVSFGKADGIEVFHQTPSGPAGARRVWVKITYDQVPRGGRWDIEIAYFEYDCVGRRLRVLQSTDYLEGVSVFAQTPPAPEWGYITPGTVSEFVGDYACKGL